MTKDDKPESGEERIDESGRNATQQRIDHEGAEPKPVAPDPAEDEPWAT
jgi:hypothetical protein